MAAGDEKLTETNLLTLTLARMEGIFGIRFGANKSELSVKTVYLSPSAHKVYVQYSKFLTALLLE